MKKNVPGREDCFREVMVKDVEQSKMAWMKGLLS